MKIDLVMGFEVAVLPFETDGLEPHISSQTVEFHYECHHKTYVKNLNRAIENTSFEDCSLEEIIRISNGKNPKVFNNAAQAWNHEFYWNCLAGESPGLSKGFEKKLARDFGSLEDLQEQFCSQAKDLFGSGWTWLVRDKQGHLKIRPLGNAGTPLTEGEIPILVCDVWEHAYYLDYQNQRPKYINSFWKIINWQFVEAMADNERLQEHWPGTRPQQLEKGGGTGKGGYREDPARLH